MQRRSEFASQREFEIEASKDHWSELESEPETDSNLSHCQILARRFRRTLSRMWRFCWHCASCGNVCSSGKHPGKKNSLECEDLEEPEESDAETTNRAFFESITKQSVGFRVFSETLSLGPKIAEGGQAEIFELESGINDAQQLVVKAFKKGYSLRSLLGTPFLRNSAVIFAGTVLNDDRFAFVMHKYWGDLRKLIDLEMTQNRHSQNPKPFLEDHAIAIMLQIAKGMELLHKKNIVHKDLKASNVLITNSSEFSCVIADYECSGGVMGTGFWRAPEVLVAVRKHDTTAMIFTQQADVYSFAMTCYEVLTGCVPFEDLDLNNYEAVIRGLRPPLPHPMNSRVTELLCRCWHSNPHERPSFGEIVLALEMVKCGSDLSTGSHNSSKRSS